MPLTLVSLSARNAAAVRAKQYCGELMRWVIRDQAVLLEVLVQGPLTWRNMVLADAKGLLINAEIADSMFRFFQVTARKKYGTADVKPILDKLEEVPDATPTEEQIEDAYEVEIASSEAAMKKFYPRESARKRKGGPTTKFPIKVQPPAKAKRKRGTDTIH